LEPPFGFAGRSHSCVDHLLTDHGYGFDEAAEWLELVDGDLFALAVHALISQDGVRRTA
jgi:hypothetical protein